MITLLLIFTLLFIPIKAKEGKDIQFKQDIILNYEIINEPVRYAIVTFLKKDRNIKITTMNYDEFAKIMKGNKL